MRGGYEKRWKEAKLAVLTSALPREVTLYLEDGNFACRDDKGTLLATAESSYVLRNWAFSEGVWAVHFKFDLRFER